MIRCVNKQCAVQKRKKNMRLAAAFCLFMGTSPINFGLLGGNGNTVKLEMTTKLKDKQTSLATVRDLLRTFATFPAPLFSHCRLPLKKRNKCPSNHLWLLRKALLKMSEASAVKHPRLFDDSLKNFSTGTA